MRMTLNPVSRRRAHPVALAMVCVLALCVSGPLTAGEEPAPAPAPTIKTADCLPSNTVLFVQAGTWNDLGARWAQTSLAKIFQEKEVQAFLAGPLGRLQSLMGNGADGQPLPGDGGTVAMVTNAISTVAPGPMVLGLTHSKEAAAAGEGPGAVLMLGMQNVDFPLSIFQGMIGMMQSKVDSLQQVSHNGATLNIFKTADMSLTVTMFKGYMIFATRESLCRSVVDGIQGTAQTKLTDNDTFKTCGLTGAEHLSVYLDVDALRRALGTGQADQQGKLREAMTSLGLENLDAIAWSLNLEGTAFQSRAAFLGRGERHGLMAALDSKPFDLEALKVCPKGAPYAIGMRLNQKELSTLLRQLIQGASDPDSQNRMEQIHAQFKAQGRDLAKEMSEAFGNEIILTRFSAEDAPTAAFDTKIACLSIKDAEKADKLLLDLMVRSVALREDAPDPKEVIKEREVEGVKVRYLTIGAQPKYALVGNRMLVSKDIMTLRASLVQLKEGSSLVDSERFKDALKGTGGEMGALFLYLDWGQIYKNIFGTAAKSIKAWVPTEYLNKAGIDINLLPAPDAVAKHLFPALAVIKTTENGMVLTSRGPLPSAEVLAPPCAAFAAVIATFGNEFQKSLTAPGEEGAAPPAEEKAPPAEE